MPSNPRLKALVVAMGLAVGSTAIAATPSVGSANTAVVTQATRLRAGDSVVGPMALTKPMRVTMSLHWRNEAQLKEFIAKPRHKNLSHAEFMAEYGPTVAQVNQVKAFLHKQGFTDIAVTPDNLLVSGEAPVATVQSAFHTRMVNVRTRKGRLAFANATPARIPAALHGVVNEVLGLQNVHRFHVMPAKPMASTQAQSGHNPSDFASIYGAGSTATASSISVGIITQGSMSNVLNDFQSFLSQNGYGNIPMNVVAVDGGGSDTSGDAEWDMDSQAIVGVGGGVQALYLYDIPQLSTQDLVDGFSKATTSGQVRVVNVSIGGCESGTETNGAATGDSVFQEADAEGVTFSISSGDSGADECGDGGVTPSWPADSQYVVAVGGTTLDTSGTTWAGETVWGGTGGSPSTFEAMPSWQQGVGQNAGHSTRGVPDVAFDADPNTGALVIVDGSSEQIGGTSLASPLFVGVWARTLAVDSSLGFAAPLIYQDAASHYSSDFHDVTSGSNGGESAATGWDYTTGFGSINIASFVGNVAGGGGGTSPPPPPPPPPPPSGTFSNNNHYVIPDNGTATSRISVTGESGAAPSDLPVHVDITHNWSGDLEIVLYAPNGAYAILQYPDYNNDGNINKTYDINASSVSSNGTWKLEVIDDDTWGDGGDYGTLNGWSMTF